MEILVKGNLNDEKFFYCANCGCVLKANKTEYKHAEQYNTIYYYCDCPTPGCERIAHEIEKEEVQKLRG